MALGEHVRTLGRGPGRSRSLEMSEARDAMNIMLNGEGAPEAVGALLMLLRMKGETPDEIAGFASAAQARLPDMPRSDLDWPCYAAGRSRGAPWLLLAAKLVARAGHTVLLHGWNGKDARIRAALPGLGIPVARTAAEADAALARHAIAYLPLEAVLPELFRLLTLRDVLHLRSCVNTVCRMLNPGRAAASVQGVFHPSYRTLQADAALRLGWSALSVIKGGGGEFERHPGKVIAGFGLRNSASWQDDLPALIDDKRRLTEVEPTPDALWSGTTDNPFARACVLGTAQLALDTLGSETKAETLWSDRHRLEAIA